MQNSTTWFGVVEYESNNEENGGKLPIGSKLRCQHINQQANALVLCPPDCLLIFLSMHLLTIPPCSVRIYPTAS